MFRNVRPAAGFLDLSGFRSRETAEDKGTEKIRALGIMAVIS